MTEQAAHCPYCGGAPGGAAFPFATRWNGRRFTYHGCRGCGASFIDPLPSAAELDAMFDRSAFHELYYARPEPSAEQLRSLDWMRPHLRPGGRMLDFGCANGAFMTAARELGFAVEGVEQNPTSIAFAREQSGLPVASLEALLADGRRFDAIHIADVLSHLPRPGELLRSLERLLAPGGLMVIEGPLEKQRNLVYLALAGGKRLKRALGRDRDAEHPPLHLTFSSWRSQDRFFRDVMGYRRIALDLHEDGWPFPTRSPAGAGAGTRAKALIGRAAVALSRSPLARPLGAFNRFRAIYAPPGC
jgi:SAM-dependent methyltransferase